MNFVRKILKMSTDKIQRINVSNIFVLNRYATGNK